MFDARWGVGLLAGILFGGPTFIAGALGATDSPPMLHAAIQQREADVAGFTVFDRVRTQSLRFPGHSETRILEVSKARRGAVVLSVVIRKFTKDGNIVDSDETATLQAELNKSPIPETAYELPISLDRETNFTYSDPTHCAACDDGVDQIDFRAKSRGENNADGTIFVNTKTHHIVKISYVPVILPKPASQASCVMQFGVVLPGLWDIVRDEQHFSGRQFFMLGRVDFVSDFEHYRRVKSEAEAREALAHSNS